MSSAAFGPIQRDQPSKLKLTDWPTGQPTFGRNQLEVHNIFIGQEFEYVKDINQLIKLIMLPSRSTFN